ncbi:NIPSNAP family protein [Bacillus suaedaesalsae]|uniref:NIPSNAP family protein n=1 Tax=Bacillus suaedaesalsae TaxID=2810349 RepID=A0ABS2DM42_9BACI|nr:NIPSNAP family protein [Bacillus suaedaesalsae]MBM6619553.1 NIPSNAP family protein [Bacillus suaedaesalsae]
MIYRRKKYIVDESIVEEFNLHFNKTLLPTQLKYGSMLIGRWMTKVNDGKVEIFAIWEYNSYTDYEEIERKVRSDEAHVERVRKWYEKMGGRDYLKNYFLKIDEDFLESTVF